MKFISELVLGILKSVAVAIILSVLALSLIQRKFPPSLADASTLLESLKKVIQLNESFRSDKQNLDALLKTDTLVTNRDKILKDLETVEAPSEQAADTPAAKKSITDTSKRDLTMLRIRLEQSEYKIRLLEYEMKQLKDEYKKL